MCLFKICLKSLKLKRAKNNFPKYDFFETLTVSTRIVWYRNYLGISLMVPTSLCVIESVSSCRILISQLSGLRLHHSIDSRSRRLGFLGRIVSPPYSVTYFRTSPKRNLCHSSISSIASGWSWIFLWHPTHTVARFLGSCTPCLKLYLRGS